MSDDKNSSQSQEVSVEKVEGVEGEEGDMSPISPPVSLGNSKSYETPVQTNDLRTSTDFYNLYDKLDELKDNEVSGTPENENNNGDEREEKRSDDSYYMFKPKKTNSGSARKLSRRGTSLDHLDSPRVVENI
eukprot:CAMPEP_0114367842 /NCGR_PEP_ID=MMETSP0101-20121206/30370_1 /TAXON_ID=38822 ORGANISM="Pteridomonas danica, Strain PT" /NCGR_SAMPLE_ID=MMETSP0101 /ASSEMBLY_ACC=CAM_ASM_000211 /LENGTH=131 /DNA_ID=CAMNT_0001517687 /DNA_START=718 /DNA_END=1113 /DNA_ORIENTATION=-